MENKFTKRSNMSGDLFVDSLAKSDFFNISYIESMDNKRIFNNEDHQLYDALGNYDYNLYGNCTYDECHINSVGLKLAHCYDNVVNQYYSRDFTFMLYNDYVDDLNNAASLLKSKEFSKALDIYKQILNEDRFNRFLSRYPSNYYVDALCRYETFNNAGICCLHLGDARKAIEYWSNALVYEMITTMQDFLIMNDIDEFDDKYAGELTSWNNIKFIVPHKFEKENPFQYIVNNEHCYFLSRHILKYLNDCSREFLQHSLIIVLYLQVNLSKYYDSIGRDDNGLKKLLSNDFDLKFQKKDKIFQLISNKKRLEKAMLNLVKIIKSNGVRGDESVLGKIIFYEIYEYFTIYKGIV